MQQKPTHFLKGFADLWLCGLWSIISKKDVLVDLAGCFFSFLRGLSVLLTPPARVWTLDWFQLHNAIKPAKTKSIWMLTEPLIIFKAVKKCLCLGSYLGCALRFRPRTSHASSTGTSASSSASSSWL